VGQHIRSSIAVILDAVEGCTGIRPPEEALLASLIGSIEKHGLDTNANYRGNAIVIGYRRLKLSHALATNRMLALKVSRWALRAFGPDAPTRLCYPVYRAFAVNAGVEPWSPAWFGRNAFGYSDAEGVA
jgi:hypothetical protein